MYIMKDVDNEELHKQRNIYIKVIVLMTIVGVVAGICTDYRRYSYDGGDIDIWRIVVGTILSIVQLIAAMLGFMLYGCPVWLFLKERLGEGWFIKLLNFSDIKRGNSPKEKFAAFAKKSCRVISILAILGACLITLVWFILKYEGVEDY